MGFDGSNLKGFKCYNSKFSHIFFDYFKYSVLVCIAAAADACWIYLGDGVCTARAISFLLTNDLLMATSIYVVVVVVQIQTMLCHLCVQLYFCENEHFAIYYHAYAIHASLPIDVCELGRLCFAFTYRK